MQATMDATAQADTTLRHRLLASRARADLLTLLRDSGQPVGVRDLARALGLHTNTVREHLDRLVEGGLVRSEASPPAGRGRPALRYRATAASGGADDGYRALASALVDQLAVADDPVAASEAAGERWGD